MSFHMFFVCIVSSNFTYKPEAERSMTQRTADAQQPCDNKFILARVGWMDEVRFSRTEISGLYLTTNWLLPNRAAFFHQASASVLDASHGRIGRIQGGRRPGQRVI